MRATGADATAAATEAAGSTAASPDALLAALLRGAGVRDLAIPGGLTPQFMEELGAVMRETLRGLLDLLAARAVAKREVRADATIIVAQDNNPLKFSPSLEAAISHLLMPRGQGFMPPLRSLADARVSLRSHQEGFVAGMRAALAAVLARFDPAKLEERLTQSPDGGSLLPMNHKAKLWNLYEELYGANLARSGDGLSFPVRRGIPARVPGQGASVANPRQDERRAVAARTPCSSRSRCCPIPAGGSATRTLTVSGRVTAAASAS